MALRRRGSERETGELVRQVFEPECSAGIRNINTAVSKIINGINLLLHESPKYNVLTEAYKITEGFNTPFPEGYEHIGSIVGYRLPTGAGHAVGYVKIGEKWYVADNQTGILIPRRGPICPGSQYVDMHRGTLAVVPGSVLDSVTHIHVSTDIVRGETSIFGVAGRAIASQRGVTCGTDSIHNVLFLGNRSRRIFMEELLRQSAGASSPPTTDYETIHDRLVALFSTPDVVVPSRYSELLKALTLMIARQVSINAIPPTPVPALFADTTCGPVVAGRRRSALRTRRRRLLKVRTNRRKHRE